MSKQLLSLRAFRQQHSIKQIMIANALGISDAALSAMEVRNRLSRANAEAITAYLSGATGITLTVDDFDWSIDERVYNLRPKTPEQRIAELDAREVVLLPVSATTVQRLILAMARLIASAQYPPEILVRGLLPVDDVSHGGKRYPGRESRYNAEWSELRETRMPLLRDGSVEARVAALGEAADVYYNAVLLEYQSQQPLVDVVMHSLRTAYGLRDEEVYSATLAKYASRLERKDHEREDALIREALERL